MAGNTPVAMSHAIRARPSNVLSQSVNSRSDDPEYYAKHFARIMSRRASRRSSMTTQGGVMMARRQPMNDQAPKVSLYGLPPLHAPFTPANSIISPVITPFVPNVPKPISPSHLKSVTNGSSETISSRQNLDSKSNYRGNIMVAIDNSVDWADNRPHELERQKGGNLNGHGTKMSEMEEASKGLVGVGYNSSDGGEHSRLYDNIQEKKEKEKEKEKKICLRESNDSTNFEKNEDRDANVKDQVSLADGNIDNLKHIQESEKEEHGYDVLLSVSIPLSPTQFDKDRAKSGDIGSKQTAHTLTDAPALQLLQSISSPLSKNNSKPLLGYARQEMTNKENNANIPTGTAEILEKDREIEFTTEETSAQSIENSGKDAIKINVKDVTTSKSADAKLQSRFMYSPAHPKAFSKLTNTKFHISAQAHLKQQPSMNRTASNPSTLYMKMDSSILSPQAIQSHKSSKKKLVKMETDAKKVLAEYLGLGNVEDGSMEMELLEAKSKVPQECLTEELVEKDEGGEDNADLVKQMDSMTDENATLKRMLDECRNELKEQVVVVNELQGSLAEVQKEKRSLESKLRDRSLEERTDNSPSSTDLLEVLLCGSTFIKHGRLGKPHARFVWVSEDLQRVCWRQPGSMRHKSFFVRDIIQVTSGKKTSVFRRQHNWGAITHNAFSIITRDPERTLNLEVDLGSALDVNPNQIAREQKLRDIWVDKFNLLVQLDKDHAHPPPPPNQPPLNYQNI